MSLGNILERVKRLPVGVLATTLGAATLSNVYINFNFNFIRHLFMLIGMSVIFLATMKMVLHTETFKQEYKNSVPASIYGTYSMLLMVLGSFLFQYSQTLGKSIWFIGIIIHALLILAFTYLHVIKNFNRKGFIPSWFIVYNGIMVAVVVGGNMKEPEMAKIITYYGLGVFFLILPFMVKRVIKDPIPNELMHTKAIFMAPASLCLVSYISVVKNADMSIALFIYGIILISLGITLYNIPKFFSVPFNPGFGALTFPMAIGTVASLRMSGFLKASGLSAASGIVHNIAGVQIFIATIIIGFVLFNFSKKIIVR